MMLIRSTWTLTLAEPTTLPRSYGIEVVKDLHRKLSLELGAESMPNTTCSGILGSVLASGDFVTFDPQQVYRLSLCGLREDASKAIAALDLPTLEFLGARFQISDREDDITNYESLYHSLVAAEPEPPQRFALKFTTPTAFAQNRVYLPLPLPTLMFRSWLERWNQFAPVYLGGDELIGYFGDAIALSQHRLQTRTHPVQQSRITGFTGDLTLRVLSRTDPLLANVANLLIHYAPFAGTGVKTRLGMGQTEIKYAE
jgi:CRISPR-associated endoribonuclease Cas6